MHALLEEQRRLLQQRTALEVERAEFDAERKKWLREKEVTPAASHDANNEATASDLASPTLLGRPCQSDQTQQPHGIELPRAEPEEPEGIGLLSLSKLPEFPIDISDLLTLSSDPSASSLTAIADLLAASMAHIRGAFLHYISVYGAAHATAALTLEQFRLFVQDCECSGGSEGQAAFDKIFRLSSLHQQPGRNSPKHAIGALSDSPAEAGASSKSQRFVVVRRLGLSAFIESIVRLGAIECADPSLASSTASFLAVVEKGAKILKYDGLGKRLQSSSEFQALFESHKQRLQALFSKLIAENECKMTSSRFTWLVQQCDLLKAAITPPKTFQICCRATSDRHASGLVNIRCDLDYNAFLEALVRLTHARLSGDVVAMENLNWSELASRTHAFLTELIYPPCVRKRIFSPH
jgi:hypothetical protein